MRRFARSIQGLFGRPAVPSDPRGTPMDLSEYRRAVAGLGAPTIDQMEDFAEFVGSAHSWYKHLPLLPPGRPFQFFLDPAAGMQLSVDNRGRERIAPRLEPGPHYSWLPTEEYRERFGHLSFSRPDGTSVSFVRGDGSSLVEADDRPSIYDPELGASRSLPHEVMSAGQVLVSGLIHPLGPDFLWHWGLLSREAPLVLSDEAGGSVAAEAIMRRCEFLAEDPSRVERLSFEEVERREAWDIDLVDYPLYELFGPERARQRGNMVAAMVRVVELGQAEESV